MGPSPPLNPGPLSQGVNGMRGEGRAPFCGRLRTQQNPGRRPEGTLLPLCADTRATGPPPSWPGAGEGKGRSCKHTEFAGKGKSLTASSRMNAASQDRRSAPLCPRTGVGLLSVLQQWDRGRVGQAAVPSCPTLTPGARSLSLRRRLRTPVCRNTALRTRPHPHPLALLLWGFLWLHTASRVNKLEKKSQVGTEFAPPCGLSGRVC